MVHGVQSFNRLHLQHDSTSNNDVEPLNTQELISITHRDLHLALERNARRTEFQANRTRIDTLKQAGAECSMNGQ